MGYSEENVKLFGLHSFRVGATTEAQASGQVSELQIQVAGRWQSAEVPRTHVVKDEHSMSKFLSIIQKNLF